MRAVVQRVSRSSVTVGEETVGDIGRGLTVLLGVAEGDTIEDAKYMAGKIANLRIFEDEAGKLNLSLLDIEGDLLAISQFTLLGDCRKGRRPGFSDAARPEEANRLYECYVEETRRLGVVVETGVFQTHMVVRIENDGPVTLLVDSRKAF